MDPLNNRLKPIDLELELQESNEKFYGLANHIPGYISYVNADTLQYEFVNEAYVQAFGIQRDKIIGSCIKDIISEENFQFALNYINEAKAGKESSYINSFKLESGTRWLKVHYKPVYDSHGIVKSIAVLSYDITESKLMQEELLLLNSQLKELIASKDRFMSIIGHDLRNPFNAILGFTEILASNINNYNKDDIENFSNIIHKSAHNACSLLENLLVWTRSQSGNLSFNPRHLCFSGIFNEVAENLKLNSITKKISIRNLTEEEIIVFADKDMLKTILRNLIANAIKFTNIGGNITILARPTGDRVTITVTDTGVGIEPEALARLFDFTLSESTPGTENESGTGLGLIICKEFVEKHGGKICIQTEPGKGTEFNFTMPLVNLV